MYVYMFCEYVFDYVDTGPPCQNKTTNKKIKNKIKHVNMNKII